MDYFPKDLMYILGYYSLKLDINRYDRSLRLEWPNTVYTAYSSTCKYLYNSCLYNACWTHNFLEVIYAHVTRAFPQSYNITSYAR